MPPGDQKIIVQDVTFALEAGNGLGVIGPSGSGKSSLVRALVGVWQPFRGKVRLDGAALDQWSSDVLGRHIGYLPQDVELFAGSVAQNICRFDPEARFGRHHRRRQGSRRAPDDHQDARRLRHPGRRAGHGAFGRAGAARGAGAGAVWQSVPDRARRAELQSRYRGRRGADAGDPRRRASAAPSWWWWRIGRSGSRRSISLLVLKDGRMQAFGPKETVLGQVLQRVAPPAPASRSSSEGGSLPNHDRRSMIGNEIRGARPSIRLHLIVGLAVVVVLAGGLGGWASTAEISGALIAPGSIVVESNVKKVQHPTGGVVGEVRAHDGDHRQGRRYRGAARRHRHQGQPRHRHQESRRPVGAGGAAAGRTAGPRQDHISEDAARSGRRSRRQERDGERDQTVRGSHHRPDRTKGAIARAGRAVERGDRRPGGAGEGQGPGNRAGRKGTGRRSLSSTTSIWCR